MEDKAPKTNRTTYLVIGLIVIIGLAVLLIIVWNNWNKIDQIIEEREEPKTPTQVDEKKAVYKITFDVVWSDKTHPDTLPDGAHVSPLIVTAHAKKDDLFTPNTPASSGIEIMAETGAPQTLLDELKNNPSVLTSLTGKVLNAPDSLTLEITLDQEHHMISAVSMLAPSPDWFVAISNVALFEEGQWVEELKLDMIPLDAGTDSGTTFTAVDIDTDPAVNISPPRDDIFTQAANEDTFATITITKQS